MARNLSLGATIALSIASVACASSGGDNAPTPTVGSAPAAPAFARMQPIPDPAPSQRRARGRFDRAEWERVNGVNGTLRPYTIAGTTYRPRHQPDYQEEGVATWYGPGFHGRRTASGEVFDQDGLSVAHRTLPMGAMVEVTNLSNGRSARLRVNDRGPFAHSRILDMSRGAARELGLIQSGSARVRVRYVGDGAEEPSMLARAAGGALDLVTAPVRLAAAVATAPVRVAAAVLSSDDDGWAVQGGAFADRSNAERLAERLGDAGEVRIRDTEADGRRLFRVLVTGFGSEADATQALSRVAALGVPQARVVRGF